MSEEIIEKMAQAAYCDSYTQYGTATPERWKQTSETQRNFFRGQMRAVAAVLVAAGLLGACTGDQLSNEICWAGAPTTALWAACWGIQQ